jgi:SUN domain-containing protein 1/2
MITIKLARKIKIDSISIDHISRYSAIDVSTAPKSFNVYGSISDSKSDFKLLLNGNYSISKEPSQNFVINGSKDELVEESIQYVSLQILNNHGNSNYTCLYRFRVHGVPV